MPDVLLLYVTQAIRLLYEQAAVLEITEEGDERVSLVPIRVPSAHGIFVEGELLDPGMLRLHYIENLAFARHVRQHLFSQKYPATGVRPRLRISRNIRTGIRTREAPRLEQRT